MDKKSISEGTLYLTISTMLFMLVGYITNIWLARKFGPNVYGTYGIVISVMSLVNLIQTSGIPLAVSKFISEKETEENGIMQAAIKIQSFFGIFITIVYYLLASLIAYFFKDSSLTPYIRISALVFPIYGLFILFTNYHNGKHNFKKQSILNTLYAVSKLTFVVGLTYIYGLAGAIIGFVVAPMLPLIIGFRLPKSSDIKFPIKKLILNSLPLIGFTFFSTLLMSVDLYMVKILGKSNDLVGFYNANQNISLIIFYGLSAFGVVLFPGVSKSISLKIEGHTKNLINKAIRYLLIFLLPFALVISATSHQIIDILYSKAYLAGSSALSILAIAYIFLTIFITFTNILNGSGKPLKSMIISIIGVLMTVFLCYFLIPRYGINGAALATGIGSLIAMTISGYFIFRHFGTIVPLKSLFKITSASLVIYFICLVIKLPNYFLPLIYLIVFTIYFILLIFLKELNNGDLDLFYSLLPKWKIRK